MANNILPGDIVARKASAANKAAYEIGIDPWIVRSIRTAPGGHQYAMDSNSQEHNFENLEILWFSGVGTISPEEALPLVVAKHNKKRPPAAWTLVGSTDDWPIIGEGAPVGYLTTPDPFGRTTTVTAVPEDVVNHPSHYKSNGLEAIDVLEAFGLTRDGRLFNVGKYILRAGKKDNELQDLKKAKWYLDRLINSIEDNK